MPLFRCVAAVVAAFLALGALAQDKPPELKLSTATGPAFAIGRAGERWAQLLNDKSAGAFEVRPYPGAVLSGRDPLRELGALRDGDADLAVGSALAWSAQLPAFGIYGLPWIASEVAEQEAIATDAAVRALVDASAAKGGIVVLAVAPLGERVLATVKAAIESPADLAGLRLRVLLAPLVVETFSVLGARAEWMSLPNAQAAFAAGTLDGQEASATTLAATRIGASGQRFVTRWGAFSDAMVFAVRGAVWAQWSAPQRDAARAAAQEAARDAAPLSREDAALVELGKQGVTVVRLTSAQRAAFRAAAEPVWAKWATPIGADLVAAATNAVAAKRNP
jgi:TRAP-type C4-dicarboxylate transport system substrate-binding protein